MKIKSPKLIQFIEDLHEYIELRSDMLEKRQNIEGAFGIIIENYLEEYFSKSGYKDSLSKASDALYWEGKEPEDDIEQSPVFGEINYPDLIINDPYLIAIVYRQISNASMVKEGIGQSLVYTMTGEFNFVYYLFHDQTDDKKITRSVDYKLESSIFAEMWDRYNVYMKII